MFLSRVHVEDPEFLDRQTLIQLKIQNAYVNHQLLWKLFPDDPDAKRDFLFREERLNSWPVFYVMSARPPQAIPGLLRVESKEYSPLVEVGDIFSFRLRANTAVTRKVSRNQAEELAYTETRQAKGLREKSTNKRVRDDVFMREKYALAREDRKNHKLLLEAYEKGQQAAIEWLVNKESSMGFYIPLVEDEFTGDDIRAVEVSGYQQHRFSRPKSKDWIEFSSVDFEGQMVVTDAQSFCRQALFQGIGPAKSFGCGLLLVRRLTP